ncbi:MAG: hypothetical protein AAB553_03680 [Patescibacteria group bacterium]
MAHYRQDSRPDNTHVFLKEIGIDDAMDAKAFYAKYLNGKSDVVGFVADVLERKVDPKLIQEHAAIIRNIGTAF